MRSSSMPPPTISRSSSSSTARSIKSIFWMLAEIFWSSALAMFWVESSACRS